MITDYRPINYEILKPKLIEYFIKFYGEEQRNLITEKLNKVELVFLNRIEDTKNAINRNLSQKRRELTIKFLESSGITVPEDIKIEYIHQGKKDRLHELPNVDDMLQLYFESGEYQNYTFSTFYTAFLSDYDISYVKEKRIKFLKSIGVNITKESYDEFIQSEEAKSIITEVKEKMALISSLNKEYSNYNKTFEAQEKLIEKGEELKKKIDGRESLNFLLEFEEVLSVSDREKLHDYATNPKGRDFSDVFNKFEGRNVIFNGLKFSSAIDSFSSQALEMLHSNEVSEWEKKEIKKNQIEYFKNIGVYDETSYEEFINSEAAIINTPRCELIDRFIQVRQQYYKIANEEYLKETSTYKQNLLQIEGYNLEIESIIDMNDYDEGGKFLQTNIRVKDGIIDPVYLIFFSPDNAIQEFLDVLFIHELNHVIETTVFGIEDGDLEQKCGFEMLKGDENRPCMLFNEVMNQEIAIQITKMMHEDGFYIFNNPNNAKLYDGTSYEHYTEFVWDMFCKFKDEILASRIGSNLDPLTNVIGTQNFDELNKLINDFSLLPYYPMMNALNKGITTELTIKYNEFIQKSKEIFANMIAYADNFYSAQFKNKG